MDHSEIDDHSTTVFCPIYLFTGIEICYMCDFEQRVTAIGTHYLKCANEDAGNVNDPNELVFLNNIAWMPEEIHKYAYLRNPNYKMHYSYTAGEEYYANLCKCGANFGDQYLFSQPGHAFCPETEDDAAFIRYHRMPFEGELKFYCGYSWGRGDLILPNAVLENIT